MVGGLMMQRQRRHRAPAEFKDKIMSILRDSGFEEARSAKLTQEDFMLLLAAFNTAGIHFC
jgi:18S rRNA (adenine1779-N6/adenine1780-N6)-dimethyltransferase